MNAAARFLDQIKKAYGLTSDYQLVKFMGWTSASRVVHYRAGRSSFDEDTCLEVAQKLHLPPGEVLAVIAAERTKSKPARAAWLALAEIAASATAKMAAPVTVAAFLSAAALSGFSSESHAAALARNGGAISPTVYYVILRIC